MSIFLLNVFSGNFDWKINKGWSLMFTLYCRYTMVVCFPQGSSMQSRGIVYSRASGLEALRDLEGRAPAAGRKSWVHHTHTRNRVVERELALCPLSAQLGETTTD